MNDSGCVQFLQWALPHMHMRWAGFRKVRNQVCKRLQRRIDQLQLKDLHAYRSYFDEHVEEWPELDKLCQITISRFYRDKMVFAFLEEQVFPKLLQTIKQRQETELRIWCAGSGAGEEPYTLALLWVMLFQSQYPAIKLSIVGTEINPEMIKRAQRACYPYSAIKNLPATWREAAFEESDDQFCLCAEYQRNIEFRCQDLRQKSATNEDKSQFHLICCRNLAFTYFDEPVQEEIIKRLHDSLVDGGVLMIGVHEEPPSDCSIFKALSKRLGIYQKADRQ